MVKCGSFEVKVSHHGCNGIDYLILNLTISVSIRKATLGLNFSNGEKKKLGWHRSGQGSWHFSSKGTMKDIYM